MALDFSNTTFILPLHSTIYKALSFNAETMSEESLKGVDKNLKPSLPNEKVKEVQKGLKTIYFRDLITANPVQSALSEESIRILKENFGVNDIYERKDGSFILNNKAEKFVSGWYGDIAYQRQFLAADKNKDGFMEKDELDETRSGFSPHGYSTLYGNKVGFSIGVYVESYIKLNGNALSIDGVTLETLKESQKTLYNQGKFAENTIALELDKTIKNDKNLDGLISHNEILTIQEMIQAKKDLVEYIVGSDEKGAGSIFDTSKLKTLLDLIIQDEELLKVFNKLELNEFDTKSLSKGELNVLRQNLPEVFDENGELKQDELKKNYESLKQEFSEKSSKFLGLEKGDGLDFNKLSSVMNEIVQNYKSTNLHEVKTGGFYA